MSQLRRFSQNLLLHAARVRPACGCHAFATCMACPSWKLEAQTRYHEEGAAGLHQLPEHAPGWRYIYDADSWAIRRWWAGGFAEYASGLVQQIRSYQRWQFRLLIAAAMMLGFGQGARIPTMMVAAVLLGAWAFRDEVSGPPRRVGRLLRRAWEHAGRAYPTALPVDLVPRYRP